MRRQVVLSAEIDVCSKNNHMIDSSTGEANMHMYWTGFTLITCKNSIAGPIVNTQSVVVLVWIILGVSIKPGLCYDIPESLYGRRDIVGLKM